ncbi:patatin family protein [Vibrio gallicus]|uniref:patatin family protein n=1 Tax=Vibrio gallicus TaxID=190897 RepID=UPI0021C30524|nr:patatin family protein [Vibrio gallicus]
MRWEDQQKYALVVQGGGQKGVFAAGVLDAFHSAEFDPFSLYLGTSAGALNVSSFVTKQRGLGLDFILNYTTKNRFFDFNKLVTKQQPMDLDWAFQFVHSGEFPLDIKRGAQCLGSEREALACVTHVEEMKDYYFPIFSENWFDVLRATCAIPLLYNNDIEIDGAKWVDGGVSATIPVQEAYRRGIKHMVVITTEPIIGHHSTSFMPVASEPFEKIKAEWHKGIDGYLQRIAPVASNDSIKQLGGLIADRVHKMKADSHWPTFNSTPKNWLPNSEKLTELLIQQSQKWRTHTPRSMEMLFSHYANHMSVSEFMNCPPEGVVIHELAPDKPLSCSGLMSGKSDILADYERGIMVGKDFLKRIQS